jgi:hypothetical protein
MLEELTLQAPRIDEIELCRGRIREKNFREMTAKNPNFGAYSALWHEIDDPTAALGPT